LSAVTSGGYSENVTTYAEDLTTAAACLLAAAELPPDRAVVELGRLLDSTATAGVSTLVREARRKAAEVALDEVGGKQVRLARLLGVSEQAIYRVLHPGVRHSR
jgi:DNA-binding NtrC family response regulator